jgi:hypothetical protein
MTEKPDSVPKRRTLADLLPPPSEEAIAEYKEGLARIEAAERAARRMIGDD